VGDARWCLLPRGLHEGISAASPSSQGGRVAVHRGRLVEMGAMWGGGSCPKVESMRWISRGCRQPERGPTKVTPPPSQAINPPPRTQFSANHRAKRSTHWVQTSFLLLRSFGFTSGSADLGEEALRSGQI